VVDLELTRTREDRRLYRLDTVGTLRLTGIWARAAEAETTDGRWRFARRGMWRRGILASDAAGNRVASFHPRDLRRGGSLRWRDVEYLLRPASSWRDRYELTRLEHVIAVIDGKGWGKRPVHVSIDDPESIDPGLVLFAVFVVHGLAEDTTTAAGGASVAVG
jgi:hypothetical protein